MSIKDLLNEDIQLNDTPNILSKNIISDQVLNDLVDILATALEDEDKVDGISTIFIPKAYLSVILQNEATQLLFDLFDKDFQNSVIKKFNIEKNLQENFLASLMFENISAGTSSRLSSTVYGYREVITLKIFLTANGTATVKLGDSSLTINNGDILAFKHNPIVPYQVIAESSDLHIISLTIKANLVDPKIIHHADNNEIGVIIDCKDMESPTLIKDLEYGLANITRLNLINHGFSNIVCFFSREDFDVAVNTLKDHGVKKILVIFAGSVIDDSTLDKVKKAEHITAWKTDETVMRKYVIFDTDKYEYFQIRGQYLSNVLDQVHNFSHKDFGISSLQPDEKTYEFLESIYNGIIPADTNLLYEAGSSQGDIIEGENIIKEIKKILLNT